MTKTGDNSAGVRKAPAEIDLLGDLDKVLKIVERASDMTSRYGVSLDSIAGGLTSEIGQDGFRSIIQRLKDATQQVASENEVLDRSLRETRKEMHSMRESLQAARHDANTDALTGLYNRRYFDSVADLLVAQARTKRTPLALMMIDIDHFKKFNDQYGHPFGDQVLKIVSAMMRTHLPTGATAARYGGEEFIALMPEIDISGVMRIADAVRSGLDAKQLVKRSTAEKIGRVTVSIGVATVKSSDSTASLIERADRCLLGAKALGRNRCVSEAELPIHAPMRKAG